MFGVKPAILKPFQPSGLRVGFSRSLCSRGTCRAGGEAAWAEEAREGAGASGGEHRALQRLHCAQHGLVHLSEITRRRALATPTGGRHRPPERSPPERSSGGGGGGGREWRWTGVDLAASRE